MNIWQNKSNIKKVLCLILASLLLSCYKEAPSEPLNSNLAPEFVLNSIQCNFRIAIDINTTTKDTLVITKMIYGLDAYYHNQYGLISKQIVSFQGYTDTLFGSAVDSKPDAHNSPVWSIQRNVPNILNDLDSVKMFVRFYGTFYSDAQLKNPTNTFYHYDSTYARITSLTFIHA